MNDKKQNWIFTKYDENPTFPFLVVDNWYTPDEEEAVWSELQLYSHLPTSRSTDAWDVARDENGDSLAKSYRWNHYDYYDENQINQFPIERSLYKIGSPEFHDNLEFTNPYYRGLTGANGHTGLISYYEEGDEYKTHYDSFAWTHLVWFYKEPKKFIGGDFTINEANVTIECKHNRAIFFPSCFLHSVDKIKMTENMPFGYGRWTISHFYYSHKRKQS